MGIQACLAILLLSSCSKSGGGYGNNNNTTPGNSNMVNIAGMAFSPASTTISKGTTVTWTNKDNMPHTVTADDNSFTSGNLSTGSTFTHTFNTATTITYHCAIHPGMTGSVAAK